MCATRRRRSRTKRGDLLPASRLNRFYLAIEKSGGDANISPKASVAAAQTDAPRLRKQFEEVGDPKNCFVQISFGELLHISNCGSRDKHFADMGKRVSLLSRRQAGQVKIGPSTYSTDRIRRNIIRPAQFTNRLPFSLALPNFLLLIRHRFTGPIQHVFQLTPTRPTSSSCQITLQCQ